MNYQNVSEKVQFDALLADKRAWLVSLCAYTSGDYDAAEDLAQETLIVAWNIRHRLYDIQQLTPRLAAIARNISRDWRRKQRRELARYVQFNHTNEEMLQDASQRSTSDFDIEAALERHELAGLLDRALALLPPETRHVLVQKYLEEYPHAEIAARLGISQGAVAVRIHRGKLALRNVLMRDLRDEVVTYGFVEPTSGPWLQTRIWCPLCGHQRLISCFDSATEFLAFRCPACCCEPNDYVAYSDRQPPGGFGRSPGYWTAFSRMMTWMNDYYQHALNDGCAVCIDCGQMATVQLSLPVDAPVSFRNFLGMQVYCPACHSTSWTLLRNLARNLPEVRQFWQKHVRICTLPERAIEVSGRPALLTQFQSVTEHASLDVVFARDSYTVLHIDGAPIAA